MIQIIKPRSRREKKFYYLSLLCLIPGFGILIGIGLIFFAIFDFRSRRLFFFILASMAGGLILLKIDMWYFINRVPYFEDAVNGRVMLSADNLDSIDVKLKVYKERTGSYPDSLQELKKVFPNLRITDPILAFNQNLNKQAHEFHYKKEGNSYVLFSVGKDGIPNTADDIYPRRPLKTPDDKKN
jgi:hypothetical protein